MAQAAVLARRPLGDYWALHRWSIEDREGFWALVAKFTGVMFRTPAAAVLRDGHRMPGAVWFDGAELNYAENILRRRDDHAAIVFRDESGRRETLSFAELERQVAGVAAGFLQRGIRPGDRIAGVLPNHPAAVVAALASARVGAIWSSCSPDFGESGILDRLRQTRPRLLIAADGYRYGGKPFDVRGKIAAVAAELPSVERVFVLPFLDSSPEISAIRAAEPWASLLRAGSEDAFASLPFQHPLYILFSSGTTGAPKCIVHGAGGTLLQHLKEHVLHGDLGPADTIFQFTTCGWMMWNWLLSALGTGATIVLYDGSPFYPDPGALWRMAAEEGVTVFGSSASYLTALEKTAIEPGKLFDLARVRLLLSTGSPLLPESFDYVYRAVSPTLQLSSISGGTDLISCFALGSALLPVHRGEIQAPGLGMAVDIFDEQGASMPRGRGELVCTRAFPSMPIGFWNDEDGSRYLRAYFERFPGVWTHGDYAERTEHGGLIIHGRSDATLNPGGVRIGTAEIYRPLAAVPEVLESIAIGQDWRGGTRVVLFVVLREGASLDEPLLRRIREAIRAGASPRHVPSKILAVADLPRTRSGKLSELAVRAAVHGETIQNAEALANAQCLAAFRTMSELQTD
jgi:acetoacetyl-CoA synthetase